LAKQTRQQTDRAGGVTSGREAPECASAACLEAALTGGRHKARNRSLVCGREEKGFVELAVAREFRFAGTQSCVLGDFARIHVMETRDANATFLGDLVQGGSHLPIRFPNRHAQITATALSPGNSQVEIPVWDKY